MSFNVSGGQIIGPDGKPFLARGINDGTIGIDGRDETISIMNTMASSLTSTFPHINMLRVTVWQSAIDQGLTAADLAADVKTLTDAGVVVEFEYHDYSTTLSGSALTTAANWYSDMASAFKGNDHVWFGSQNEPPGGDIDTEITTLYNAVRSTGNNTIFMMGESGGYTTNGLNPATYTSMHNVVWDTHFYSWEVNGLYGLDPSNQSQNAQALSNQVSAAESFTHSADGTIPAIVGEFGPAAGGAIDTGGDQTVKSVEQNGVGATAWSWETFNSGNPAPGDLVNSPWTGGPGSLTPFGQSIAQWISSSPAPAAGGGGTTSGGNVNDPILITPGNGTFKDAAGNTYAIDTAGNADENGAPIPNGSGTGVMEYANSTVYGQDAASGQWYTWNQSTWTASAAPPAPSSGGGGTTTPPPPAPSPVTTGTGTDALVLSISEDAYQGDAQFTVSVDGKQQGGTFTAKAIHGSADQTFTFNGDWATGSHTVSVNFLNDAWGGTATTDRNLYVDSATYDGTATGKSLSMFSQGAQTFAISDTTALPVPPVTLAAGTYANEVDQSNVSIVATSGDHMLFVGGTGDTVTMTGGKETVLAFQGGNQITTGASDDRISIAGSSNVVDAGAGHNTIADSGSGNILVAPSAGMDDVFGSVFTNGDVIDFRAALANTAWTGDQSTLGNFLHVSTAGSDTTVTLSATANGGALSSMDFHNVGAVSMNTILATSLT